MSKYSFAAELEKYGPRPTHTAPITPRQARRYCRRLAKGHYENFTVVSRLFPSRLRQDFCHLYAYCRWADDLADETGDAKLGLALLNWWETQLRACFQGQTVHPVFIALSETIKRYKMPIDPFVDLLAAFRQDQRVQRYETFDQVTDYCRYSANPVGRLMTVYCDHAEGFLRGGWPLVGLVPYDLQLSVAVFIHGGLAILQNIRRQNFDVWTTRPSVSKIEKLRIVAKCWWRLQRGTLAGSEP